VETARRGSAAKIPKNPGGQDEESSKKWGKKRKEKPEGRGLAKVTRPRKKGSGQAARERPRTSRTGKLSASGEKKTQNAPKAQVWRHFRWSRELRLLVGGRWV